MVTCPIALKLASNVVRPSFFLVLFKGSTCPVMVNRLFCSFWALKALYTTHSHSDAWQELRCYQLVVGWHWSLLWILGDLDCLAFSISVAFHLTVSPSPAQCSTQKHWAGRLVGGPSLQKEYVAFVCTICMKSNQASVSNPASHKSRWEKDFPWLIYYAKALLFFHYCSETATKKYIRQS